jgi:hypothetical protein
MVCVSASGDGKYPKFQSQDSICFSRIHITNCLSAPKEYNFSIPTISPTACLVQGNIIFYTVHFTSLFPRNIIFLYRSFHQLPILFQGTQICIPSDAYNFLTYSTQKATLYVLIPLSETSSGVVHMQVTSLYRGSVAILRDVRTIFQH